MPDCAVCGSKTVRTKRNLIQRVYSVAIFKCLRCDNRTHLTRPVLGILKRHVQCPQCGNRTLTKLKSIDKIDSLNKNPVRLLLAIFRAPLYHCTFCRLQFWDFRSRRPEANERAASVGGTNG